VARIDGGFDNVVLGKTAAPGICKDWHEFFEEGSNPMGWLEAEKRYCRAICRRLLLTGLLAGLVSYCPVNAQERSTLQKRFLAEAPQGWQHYLEFCRTLQGNSDGERRDNGKLTQRMHFQGKQCAGNRLDQVEIFQSDSYSGSVSGNNTRYHFELARKNPDKPWVVVGIKLQEEKAPPIPFAGLSLDKPGRFLPDLITSSEFELLSVTPERQGNEELVRVTFAYAKEKDPLRGGWFLLDPQHDWVIRKGQCDLVVEPRTTILYTIHHEYKQGSQLHPIITKAAYRSTAREEQRLVYEYEITTNFSFFEQDSVPEREFTLSAFDLPEPLEVKPTRTRWYLWAAGAGLTCLLAGAIVRRRRRRQA
jgi:hypothetical protein